MKQPYTAAFARQGRYMEEFKVSGAKLMSQLKELIHEGNVRRIVLRNPEGRTLLDMPLAAGIAGAALLPFWAAVGAVAVLATDYAIFVERDPESAAEPASATADAKSADATT